MGFLNFFRKSKGRKAKQKKPERWREFRRLRFESLAFRVLILMATPSLIFAFARAARAQQPTPRPADGRYFVPEEREAVAQLEKYNMKFGPSSGGSQDLNRLIYRFKNNIY